MIPQQTLSKFLVRQSGRRSCRCPDSEPGHTNRWFLPGLRYEIAVIQGNWNDPLTRHKHSEAKGSNSPTAPSSISLSHLNPSLQHQCYQPDAALWWEDEGMTSVHHDTHLSGHQLGRTFNDLTSHDQLAPIRKGELGIEIARNVIVCKPWCVTWGSRSFHHGIPSRPTNAIQSHRS